MQVGAAPVTSNVITVDGYKQPDVTLNASKAAICETDGDIILTIAGMKKRDVVNSWKKDGAVLIGEKTAKYTASNASQGGNYATEVGNTVCVAIDQDQTDIKIFEQPTIVSFQAATSTREILPGGRYVYSIQDKEGIASGTIPTKIVGIVNDNATTSYVWSAATIEFEQGLPEGNFTKEGETEGTEWVSLVVYNGEGTAVCKDSAGFNMGVSLPLNIPNAFSPNGDGANDKWVIQGMNDFPDAQVTIFNRWGAKLYEKFAGYPADKAWDGEGMPVGTYYYILKLNDPVRKAAGQDDVVRGAVTITR